MVTEDERPTRYAREKLYEEVWAEPARVVAERYGVSDVSLAKTCGKMAIPLPGRGYWARRKAGQSPPTKELPPSPSGVRPERSAQIGGDGYRWPAPPDPYQLD